jgi:phosphoribosyl 1,2-cyclic phosphodiesterase
LSQDEPDIEWQVLESHRPTQVASFTVAACRTNHDAAEPLALRICEQDSGAVVGLAYDIGRISAGIRHLLRDCDCLIVEANHDEMMLRTGPYPPSVRQRIAGSGGHLSNRAAAELLVDLLHAGLRTVVLAHLSGRCNSPQLAGATVSQELATRGFSGNILVARQRDPLPVFEVLGSDVQRALGIED